MLEKKWWHEKVAYQIYPKSFLDTNGDGIGDLGGIISKLDYLKELGVDILWISPCYPSPMADQGYDISDYMDIDPCFGTMADMDELLAEAKKRGIDVILDLVVNHCSDEHKWFQAACEDPDGKYGKYFYIADVVDGKVPNNWRSHFGGSIWEPLPGHPDKVYLHSFHKKQPDLNWTNREVREEIYRMMNWWLDKGLAGFRLDAIINLYKPDLYVDYPTDLEDGLCQLQRVLNTTTGIDDILREMKERTFTPHNSFTVGEVTTTRPDALEVFIGNDGHFSTMFDFDSLRYGAGGNDGWYRALDYVYGEDYKQAVFAVQKRVADTGYIANLIENHDRPRGASHFMPGGVATLESKKLLAVLNFMLKGIPFIYQGQEIGMENMVVHSIEECDDINAHNNYDICIRMGFTPAQAMNRVNKFNRDNGRTPMQWSGEDQAGFTTGTPWMRVNKNYPRINVESQLKDPDSLLSWYKQLTALRHDPAYKEAVVYGEFIPFKEEQENLMAYYRRGEEKCLLIIGNYQAEAQDVVLPGEIKRVLMNNFPTLHQEGEVVHLEGYQAIVLDM